MLVFDFHTIGDSLYAVRKRKGMTQAEVAEATGLSCRTYAEIERGSANMRMETFLHICRVLQVTPDEILTKETQPSALQQEQIWQRLEACSLKEKETALRLLSVYLQSLK